MRTGNPFTLGTNQCIGSFNNCLADLANGQDPNNAPSGGRTPDQWFDTSAILRPTAGTPGNLGLQSNNLPERFKAQFRAEAFNLTNTPQWGAPNGIQGDPNFGRIFTPQHAVRAPFHVLAREV